jgi:hypothetical protein
MLIVGLSFMAVTKGSCPTGTVTLNTQAQINNFINVYPGCTTLDALVLDGPSITNLEGIGHLTSITGVFEVKNTGLKSFKRLDKLHTVGEFIVKDNPALVRFSGTPKLATVIGSIIIENNPSLIHFDKLHTINSVGEDIILSNLPSVEDFVGMHNIQSLNGTLQIDNCSGLASLEGFEGMTQLNAIVIDNNNNLSNISALGNVDAGSLNSLTITDNSALSACSISSVCGFVGQTIGAPNGDISGNDSTCADANQVQTVCMASMPVELLDFSVRKDETKVLVSWSTASEFNNKGFEVQRSSNGVDWQVLGFIDGHATTDRLITYSFIDDQPSFNMNYYRLKQIDFDGSYDFSNINMVDFSSDVIKVFPNPAVDQINFSEEYRGSYVVYNSLGEVVLSGFVTTSIQVDQLKAGVYFIRLDRSDNLVRFLIK